MRSTNLRRAPYRVAARRTARALLPVTALLLFACGGDDAATDPDTTTADVGAGDTSTTDASSDDASTDDADTATDDANPGDTSTDDADPGPITEAAAVIADTHDGPVLRVSLGSTTVDLRPRLFVDGVAEDPTACTTEDGALTCTFPVGSLRAEPDDRGVALALRPTRDAELQGIELVGAWDGPQPDAFLSAGFQSWSQTGFLRLARAPADDELLRVVAQRGDDEVVRDGRGHSWFHSIVTGPDATSLVVGVTGEGPLKPWIAASIDDGVARVRLVQGRTGDRLALAADAAVPLAPWSIRFHTDPVEGFRAYADRLTWRTGHDAVELGWNSWYELWDSVSATDVLANAAIARRTLGEGSGDGVRIVIDDGWQVAWGDWEPNEKFPDGIDGLVQTLRAEGHDVGIWFAPLIASTNSAIVRDHPDWFVGGVSWRHLVMGEMRILDVTHPDAAAHLAAVVDRMRGWGIDLLKIDFLFAGTFEGDRHETMTGMMAYARAMALLRQAAGDDIALLAVGAPPVVTFPYAEAWRVGPDIALSATPLGWPFIANQARAIGGRWAFCAHIACDGDPALLRTLPRNEVDVGQWVAALAGGAFFLSDNLPELPEDRLEWLLPDAVALGIGGVPAIPVDFVPANLPDRLTTALVDTISRRNRHILPSTWRLPGGHTLVINWTDAELPLGGTPVPARSAALRPEP